MSRRKRSVILSPRAQDDREHIYRHGTEVWGETHADDYLEELFRALDTLAAFPETGREQDDLRSGLRSRPVGAHVVYYEVRRDSIWISRIPHARQDPTEAAGI